MPTIGPGNEATMRCFAFSERTSHLHNSCRCWSLGLSLATKPSISGQQLTEPYISMQVARFADALPGMKRGEI